MGRWRTSNVGAEFRLEQVQLSSILAENVGLARAKSPWTPGTAFMVQTHGKASNFEFPNRTFGSRHWQISGLAVFVNVTATSQLPVGSGWERSGRNTIPKRAAIVFMPDLRNW